MFRNANFHLFLEFHLFANYESLVGKFCTAFYLHFHFAIFQRQRKIMLLFSRKWCHVDDGTVPGCINSDVPFHHLTISVACHPRWNVFASFLFAPLRLSSILKISLTRSTLSDQSNRSSGRTEGRRPGQNIDSVDLFVLKITTLYFYREFQSLICVVLPPFRHAFRLFSAVSNFNNCISHNI